MTPPRIAGAVLLIIGIVLLIVGINSSHSLVDQVSNTITGRFTQATTWYIIGGIALSIFGFLLAFMGFGKSAAK